MDEYTRESILRLQEKLSALLAAGGGPKAIAGFTEAFEDFQLTFPLFNFNLERLGFVATRRDEKCVYCRKVLQPQWMKTLPDGRKISVVNVEPTDPQPRWSVAVLRAGSDPELVVENASREMAALAVHRLLWTNLEPEVYRPQGCQLGPFMGRACGHIECNS